MKIKIKFPRQLGRGEYKRERAHAKVMRSVIEYAKLSGMLYSQRSRSLLYSLFAAQQKGEKK